MIIKAVILFLIRMGDAITSVLPQHDPLQFPDLAPLFSMFYFLGSLDRWVVVGAWLTTIVVVLGFELAFLLYAAWRALLGLIPALK